LKQLLLIVGPYLIQIWSLKGPYFYKLVVLIWFRVGTASDYTSVVDLPQSSHFLFPFEVKIQLRGGFKKRNGKFGPLAKTRLG